MSVLDDRLAKTHLLEIADALVLRSLTTGPFQTNLYVVGCATTGEAAIVDGGGDAEGLIALAQDANLTIKQLLQTHAHIDHVLALPRLRELLPSAPIAMHPYDQPLYDSLPMQAAMFGLRAGAMPPIDARLEDGQTVRVGDLEAEVILAPGHSPGSVIFYFRAQALMLSGDVLFAGSIGRVDLPGADIRAMQRSLDRLKTFPPNTLICSGHGPVTTLGQEIQTNPFLKGRLV